MGSNPVGASDFYLITARITFICILYLQCTHMIFMIYTSCQYNIHCFQRGFIAQLVEHRTGIAEVMGSNPIEASDFFSELSLLHNCKDQFHFYTHNVTLPFSLAKLYGMRGFKMVFPIYLRSFCAGLRK